MSKKDEEVGAAVLAVVDRVRNNPRYALGRRHLQRRKAKHQLAAVAEALTALSLVRRRDSRRRLAALATAAFVFDRLARQATERA
jgi:hypothetical protein